MKKRKRYKKIVEWKPVKEKEHYLNYMAFFALGFAINYLLLFTKITGVPVKAKIGSLLVLLSLSVFLFTVQALVNHERHVYYEEIR